MGCLQDVELYQKEENCVQQTKRSCLTVMLDVNRRKLSGNHWPMTLCSNKRFECSNATLFSTRVIPYVKTQQLLLVEGILLARSIWRTVTAL